MYIIPQTPSPPERIIMHAFYIHATKSRGLRAHITTFHCVKLSFMHSRRDTTQLYCCASIGNAIQIMTL